MVEKEPIQQDEIERQMQACRISLRRSLLSELEGCFDGFKALYPKQLKNHLNALKTSKCIVYLTKLRQEYHLKYEDGKDTPAVLSIHAYTPEQPPFCKLEINSATFEFTIHYGDGYNLLKEDILREISNLDFSPHLNRLNALMVQDFVELQKIKEKIASQKSQGILSVSASLAWGGKKSGSDTQYHQIETKVSSTGSRFGIHSWTVAVSDSVQSRRSFHHEEIAFIPQSYWNTNAIQSAIDKSYLKTIFAPKH